MKSPPFQRPLSCSDADILWYGISRADREAGVRDRGYRCFPWRLHGNTIGVDTSKYGVLSAVRMPDRQVFQSNGRETKSFTV